MGPTTSSPFQLYHTLDCLDLMFATDKNINTCLLTRQPPFHVKMCLAKRSEVDIIFLLKTTRRGLPFKNKLKVGGRIFNIPFTNSFSRKGYMN